eukprot:Awhi_evm1s9694
MRIFYTLSMFTYNEIESLKSIESFRRIRKRKLDGGFATYLVGLRDGVGRFESIDEYEDFFSEEEEEVLLQRVRTRQQATRPNVLRSAVFVPSSGSPQRKSKNYAPSQLKTHRSEDCTGFPRMQVVRKEDGKITGVLKYCDRCGNRNSKVAICSLCNRSLCTDNVNSKGSKAEITDVVGTIYGDKRKQTC